MPKPSAPQNFTDGSDYVASASTNANNQLWYNALNNYVLYQDVAGTVTVSHTWTATQSFPAGSTISGYLPLAGGTLTGALTGTSGVFSGTMTLGSNPATTGTLRLPNGFQTVARNASNNADLFVLSLDGSNVINLGDSNCAGITLGKATTLASTLTVTGATTLAACSSTAFSGPLTGNVTGNVSGSAGSVAAANITGSTLASGVTASSLTSVGTLTALTVAGTSTLAALSATTGTFSSTLGVTGGTTLSGALQHNGTAAGFFGTSAIGKPAISGSRAGVDAMAVVLLNTLASLGLVTNNTTP